MASSHDNLSMAVFCDFENVALGVRDANYEKFDIKPILEKLLLKGSIVVKKAYCDWDRYKGHKATMHEANFELIEIPHVRQSGKNSADIRMVVDALDLCYTKSHVNTFVIISGDSDFSPLVSKLRENAKTVIGVGIKQSTSDLLVANCDEFIFYDDLVRERQRQAARKQPQQQQPKRSSEESSRRKEELESRKSEAIEMVVETFDALTSERGDSGKIWASLLKDTLKRRRPDFNETYYGFRTFGNLLEEAQGRGLLEFGRDEKSGAYVYRPSGAQAAEQVQMQQSNEPREMAQDAEQAEAHAPKGKAEPRRRTRGGRKSREEQAEHAEAVVHEPVAEIVPEPVAAQVQEDQAQAVTETVEEAETPRRRPARKAPARKAKAAAKTAAVAEAPVEPVAAAEPEPAGSDDSGDTEEEPKRAARKPAARSRRPAKPKA
ncbi:MAG TPA: NYN domain-containing protein [Telluria sp.]|nr:NYN domain-containing protein [Telluria sp.]